MKKDDEQLTPTEKLLRDVKRIGLYLLIWFVSIMVLMPLTTWAYFAIRNMMH